MPDGCTHTHIPTSALIHTNGQKLFPSLKFPNQCVEHYYFQQFHQEMHNNFELEKKKINRQWSLISVPEDSKGV
jgi:hypothetical protein